jgi:hypothetical protein
MLSRVHNKRNTCNYTLKDVEPGECRKFDEDDPDENKLGDAKIKGRGAICTGYWEVGSK